MKFGESLNHEIGNYGSIIIFHSRYLHVSNISHMEEILYI